jgi:hypothetical protein
MSILLYFILISIIKKMGCGIFVALHIILKILVDLFSILIILIKVKNMKKRPLLKKGDIVRFSKKGKQADYPWANNITMIVKRIKYLSLSDFDCLIECRATMDGEPVYIQAYRHHLWYTGKNIKDINASR